MTGVAVGGPGKARAFGFPGAGQLLVSTIVLIFTHTWVYGELRMTRCPTDLGAPGLARRERANGG